MGRFWNLKTKFIGVLILILMGCFAVQKYVHARNEERLLDEVVVISEEIANQVTERLELAQKPRWARMQMTLRLNRPANQPAPSLRVDVGQLLRAMHEIEREFAPGRVPPGADPRNLPDERPPPPGRSDIHMASSPADTPPTPASDEIAIEPYTLRLQALFADYRRHDLLATAGVFLMGIALAWLLGERMTRPVSQIVDGFRAVAAGDLQVSVPEPKSGELALLGRQFNRMVERLRENRQRELELEQRERLQLMGDLAAGVAHDVRNPLNAIRLNVGQIRDEFVPASEPARERFLRFTSDVQQEVVRLNRLVTDFLSLARPTPEEMTPSDANSLLRDIARLLRKEAVERQVDVRLALDDALPPVTWNQQEMMSAFLNVAMNGLQAMEPDGGTLELTSGVRTGEHGAELAISFIDSGCGIPADQLERVFLPYFTTRKGGTGLGMAIARRVAERNGGRIELRSAVGEGTSVSFLFPMSAPEGRVA